MVLEPLEGFEGVPSRTFKCIKRNLERHLESLITGALISKGQLTKSYVTGCEEEQGNNMKRFKSGNAILKKRRQSKRS